MRLLYIWHVLHIGDYTNVPYKPLIEYHIGNSSVLVCTGTGLVLALRQANKKRLYKVTPSLISWSQT